MKTLYAQIPTRTSVESMNPYVAQINLAFQVVILFALLVSLFLKNRNKLFLHGSTMLVAVILNTVSFMLIMLPSLFNLESFIKNYPSSRLSATVVAHSIFGGITEIFALWIVISWRLRSDVQHCAGKKTVMRVTIMLWLIALSLGILTYWYLYGF